VRRGLALWAAAVFSFLHLPLAVLTVFSFNASRFTVWKGWSLHWYRAALNDAQLAEATRNSLVVAGVATVVATALGTLCAYGLWKRRSRLLSHTLNLTLVTPEIVMGVSLLAFFQFTLRGLGLKPGLHTVMAAHVMFSLAYVVLVVGARLRTMDPALEEAALDLGATHWVAFTRVTLPLLAPGVAAAAMLVFALSFDDYVITSLVAGVDSETLPMVIYALARRGANPVVNAISTLVVAVPGLLIVAAGRLQRR
jgi:spermidine/putrescine transport system permease protein